MYLVVPSFAENQTSIIMKLINRLFAIIGTSSGRLNRNSLERAIECGYERLTELTAYAEQGII